MVGFFATISIARVTNGGEGMSRIIIDNKSSLSDYDAVSAVKRVILDGFRSTETIQGERNIQKYCHATIFKREFNGKKTIVWARPRKTKASAYSFLVYDEEEKE
jgi:hypothetical protein